MAAADSAVGTRHLTLAQELTCPIDGCDYVPPSGTVQGLSMHLSRTHGILAKDRRPEPGDREPSTRTRLAQNARAEAKVVELLQTLFPKGIPTEDAGELVESLHLIDTLRQRCREVS